MLNELLDWKNKFKLSFFNTKKQLADHPDLLKNIPQNPTFFFVGMGASGIAGKLFELILSKQKKQTSIKMINSNRIPEQLPIQSVGVICSFSGNTWETIEAFHALHEQKIPLIILTHGGTLATFAQKKQPPLFTIPACSAPRASLGSFIGIILALLEHLNLTDHTFLSAEKIEEFLSKALERHQKKASFEPFLVQQKNDAPLHIFGVSGDSDAAAYRAQTQFNENSKVNAFFHAFPELCHNAIVGIIENQKAQSILFMATEDLSNNEKKALVATKKLLDEYKIPWYHVQVCGQSWLEQLIDLIIWADFASFYLAQQNNKEVTPVKAIDQLKEYFSAV